MTGFGPPADIRTVLHIPYRRSEDLAKVAKDAKHAKDAKVAKDAKDAKVTKDAKDATVVKYA